ncbi:hypothetical protein ACEWY4_001297 [Coilia grayii]|uniref:BEN domain-containing protein n=1 Tax=Coilia grayii TaxID=363190 RepID=A0ABD1KSI3_9TELE
MLANLFLVLSLSVLPNILEKIEAFLCSPPRPSSAPISRRASGPSPTPTSRPAPSPLPAPTSRPAPSPLPAPTPSPPPSPPPAPTSRPAPITISSPYSLNLISLLKVIPKGLVERCSTQTPQKFVNDLLHGLYSREYMASHSVTGQSSIKDKEAKPGLEKADLVEITNAAKLKFPFLSETNIKAFIRQKFNNAAKLN